jgi:hypothetical protein
VAVETTYTVQTFELQQQTLVAAARETASSSAEALMRAEACSREAAGSVAFRMARDADTDELYSLIILGTFGQVPGNFVGGLFA